MFKKILFRILIAMGIFVLEATIAIGLFLLMVIIIFGLMSGCSTAQEFIHIFV